MSEQTSTHEKETFGDVHPVIDIEGIGEAYADQLDAIGIEDTWDLHEANALRIARKLDASPSQVRQWQRMAALIAINGIGPQYAELLVRAGVSSTRSLSVADPVELTRRVNETEDALEVNIQGNEITQPRVERWIKMAREYEASATGSARAATTDDDSTHLDQWDPREDVDDGQVTETKQRVVERRLSEEERERLDELAKPGAEYLEESWRKHAREDLDQIRDRVDRLEGGSPRRRQATTSRRGQRPPPGLRSRISEAYGPLAHVRLAYSTRNHHVCHVGLRRDGQVRGVILLVGPEEIEEFETVERDVDALLAARKPGTTREGEDPFGDIDPVIDIEGIGEVYSEKLAELGIETTQDLWHAKTHHVADELDVSPKRVQNWQQMAELMAINGIGPQYAELLVRAGIGTIKALANRDAEEIMASVKEKEGDVIPSIQGNQVGEGRIKRWITLAEDHDPDA